MKKGKLYTSYFAKIKNGIGIKISIARYNPKWLKDNDISFWFKDLAPNEKLLKDYKYNGLSWDDYEKRYRNQIETDKMPQDLIQLISILDNGQNVTVYCYEKPTDNCHRRILGDIIESMGYEAEEIK